MQLQHIWARTTSNCWVSQTLETIPCWLTAWNNSSYQSCQPHILASTTKISQHIVRQVLELEEYNIRLQHVPGKSNGRADALSRRPDYDQGTEDNQGVMVLPDKLFMRAMNSQELKQSEAVLKPWVDPHKLKQICGMWWKGNQLVITADTPARWSIVQVHHNPPAYGHPGISRTYKLTARRYWWPCMWQDVMDYVKGCTDCQQNCYRQAPIFFFFTLLSYLWHVMWSSCDHLCDYCPSDLLSLWRCSVTHCSGNTHCSCDVYCSHYSIVLVYYMY